MNLQQQVVGENHTSQAAMDAVYHAHNPELKLKASREMGDWQPSF